MRKQRHIYFLTCKMRLVQGPTGKVGDSGRFGVTRAPGILKGRARMWTQRALTMKLMPSHCSGQSPATCPCASVLSHYLTPRRLTCVITGYESLQTPVLMTSASCSPEFHLQLGCRRVWRFCHPPGARELSLPIYQHEGALRLCSCPCLHFIVPSPSSTQDPARLS